MGVATMAFYKAPDPGLFLNVGGDGMSLAAFLPVLLAIMLGAGREFTVLAAISAAFTMTFLA